MESNSSNAISWASHDTCKPWQLHFYLNEIKSLESRIDAFFTTKFCWLMGWPNTLVKQGVDRVVPWEALL